MHWLCRSKGSPCGHGNRSRKSAVHACDASDGVKDGVIENPLMCKYDYSELACKAGDGPNCLTKGQIESAKAMTSPLTDPKTGKSLFDGHLMPGSELGWATLGGPAPLAVATSGMRNVVFKDPSWDYHKMNIATDIELAAESDNGAMYSGDPNLKPFFDHVLLKTGKLTDEEFECIRKHSEFGWMVLRNLNGMEEASLILLHHHERFGGGGYPGNLCGDDIPLGARIIAVADTYDALTTDRPYRKAREHQDAVREIQRHIDTQFDRLVVDAFIGSFCEETEAPLWVAQGWPTRI